jgi:hypothetical protein
MEARRPPFSSGAAIAISLREGGDHPLLVDRLIAARLLVAEHGDTIRVAHDALLRNWQRAQDLLKGERELAVV